MKIGVFDSGVGGLSVANAIQAALPMHDIILREDKKNLPYGNKTPEQLLSFVVPIFAEMIAEGCRIIVVACNTVSTNIIADLRAQFPDTPLIAIEPMVKPAAALTRSKVIAVCATPVTLASARYASLKQEYAAGITVLEPDCSDWSVMIQAERTGGQKTDSQKIADRINEVLASGADVIVLACTHYHWIEDQIIEQAAGRAQVLQPEPAIIRQLKRVIDGISVSPDS